MMLYRPKSIVEYQRKAYIASENKTRITFDFDIKATESDFRIFAADLNQNPVMDKYLVVMEVKSVSYTHLDVYKRQQGVL